MTRKSFRNRLKVTRNSIEKFCHDLKLAKLLTNSDRPGQEQSQFLVNDDDDDELRKGFFKTMVLEKLDLSNLGPAFEPDDNENIPLISTPRKGFDLPMSPRYDNEEKNGELLKFRRKSQESPRSFLNGTTSVASLGGISKKENLTSASDIHLVSFDDNLMFNVNYGG
ncbi:unnamed protein product [Caenorhabditis bovis]|uniref:Uncharacterized protein n=1 Tax=Caenorhabditis bovis TaxID=2654633 RepID=A0A8S1EP44_9PELO|nr:unnamed protein product [Caenorhabditis bovis]